MVFTKNSRRDCVSSSDASSKISSTRSFMTTSNVSAEFRSGQIRTVSRPSAGPELTKQSHGRS
jgi:hypothetical protein